MRNAIASMTVFLVLGAWAAAGQAPATSAPDAPKAKSDHAAMAKGTPGSSAAKIQKAASAAPADIGRHATIMDLTADGQMKSLRDGTNGWMCMTTPMGDPMCLDKEWQNWAEAWMSKKDPQIKGVGLAYMLRGDKGASNTDPYATAAAPGNDWVVSGPHVMVLTPDAAQLDALPTDWHSGGPWVMWKGTKYAHIMVPTGSMSKPAAPAKTTPPATPVVKK
jgi:hypothetical protein